MADKEGCSGWKAVLNAEPPAPFTLHVTGNCHFDDSGYTVELKPAVPQGINPNVYILHKIVHKPAHVSHHPSNVAVDYTEKVKVKYTEVQIIPDNVTVTVQVVQ
jgi:hypothetical protein